MTKRTPSSSQTFRQWWTESGYRFASAIAEKEGVRKCIAANAFRRGWFAAKRFYMREGR